MLTINLQQDPAIQRVLKQRECTRAWRKSNLEHVREYRVGYQKLDKARAASRQRDVERYDPARGKISRWKYHLRTRYGLTIEQYEEMRRLQLTCGVCSSEFGKAGPQLDHCHTTGRVRGLLCKRCNTRMAVIDDDAHLQKLITYRDLHRGGE